MKMNAKTNTKANKKTQVYLFFSLFLLAVHPLGFAATDQSTVIVAPPEEGVKPNSALFADHYSEHTALARAQTFASYTQLRGGLRVGSDLEVYAAGRFGADSRTIFEQGRSIYNDNYVFLGGGVDYLGLLPGVRLVAQVGASIDLSSKIHAGGLDGRVGVVTYHEVRNEALSPFYSEIYTEALYIHRYRNVLASGQFRVIYSGIHLLDALGPRFKLDPMLNLVTSMDSGGMDFNRFFEARMGVRLSYRGPVDLILIPYYSLGTRFQGPANTLGYQDFRALLVVAKSI